MTDSSQWRLDISRQLARKYARNPNVAAYLVVGGLANGRADAYSDLDSVVLWHETPKQAERRAAIADVEGYIDILLDPSPDEDPALQEWSDTFYLGGDKRTGLKVDVSHTLVMNTAKLIADVIDHHDQNSRKLGLLYSLNHTLPLYGEDIFNNLMARASRCPLLISERIVQKNLRFFPQWSYDMLGAREDWVLYSQLMTQAVECVMYILIGLNRQFPPFRLKHMSFIISEFEIKPSDFEQQVVTILRGEPSPAVESLITTVTETFDLVEQHMPQVDSRSVRDNFNYRRAQLEALRR
jgi:hypothetical protein